MMVVVTAAAVGMTVPRRGRWPARLFKRVLKNMLRVLQRLGSGMQHFSDFRRFGGQLVRPLQEFRAVAVIVLNPMRQQHPHFV